MEKDKTIISLISRLKSIISFSLLEIVDYWEADLCAIGLKRGDRLVFISTYNFIGEKSIKYDFDLELLNLMKPDKIKVIKTGRCVDEDELIAEIKFF